VDVLDKIGLVDLNESEAENLSTILKLKNSSIDVEIISARGERDFREYDYVYNGTGLGKSDSRSPISQADQFNPSGIAFDANYTPSATPFLKQLSDWGCRSINGLNHMLMCTSLHLSAVTGESVPIETVKRAYDRIVKAPSGLSG
jgi:shikimate 5-dehydrogenase